MGCIFCNFDGDCEVFSEEIENPGWNELGQCVCEDDLDPSCVCEYYQNENEEEEEEEDWVDELNNDEEIWGDD